jgi:hypothetical protein
MTKGIAVVVVVGLLGSVRGQQPAAPPPLIAATHTAYSAKTELFAEWRPFIVGEPTRLTAHLTHTGERFQAFADGRVAMTLTVEDATVKATADAPERAGVFRLNVTPTKPGIGRMVLDVTSGGGNAEHFVIDNVSVYRDLAAATAAQKPAEAGLISFAKERSWAEDFATAPVATRFPGAGRMILVPTGAIVREEQNAFVYVQHTPERFEFRQVTLGRTFGELVQISNGLSDVERVVVRGADKMPRK